MDNTHYISTNLLTLEDINEIIYTGKQIGLSEEAKVNIQKCREYLDAKMESNTDPIYGINTGFGSLYNIRISDENLTQLQENLVKSHACGTGDIVPDGIVRIMLLLKVQSLND
jgi:histidine ammonia-lyase